MTVRAPAPTRATASTILAAGPLLIPVQIFAGTESSSGRFVKRSEYTKDGRPVGRLNVVRGSEPPEIVDEVVRCAEHDGQAVPLSDNEITLAIYGQEDVPATAEIQSFVPLHLMGAGRFMPEGLKQVRPKKGKKRGTYDPASAKAFATLLKAMREEQVFALVLLAQAGRPSYYALLPTGKMYDLVFDDEVREDLPLPAVTVDEADVELVKSLFTIDRDPDLANVFRAKIEAYVAKKAEDGTKPADPEPTTVEDLLQALRGE